MAGRVILAALALAALSTNVFAALAPRLVKDINVGVSPVGSDPGVLATIGNITLFFADDGESGNELWRTDGTKAGTFLVRDIHPGPASGVPDNRFGAVVVNGRMIFHANDGDHGLEYWASDGTKEGTVLLADIMPGFASSNPSFVQVAPSTFYFSAVTHETGQELWRTDGTPAGTRLAVDLNPGPGGSFVRGLGRLGSRIVMTGTDGRKTGIFTTDGTAEGTKFVADVQGASSGASFGSQVLFITRSTDSWSLLSTDGTTVAVVRSGFRGDGGFVALRQFNNALYFFADDGVHGTELWRTDGTSAGTQLAVDVTPGAAGSQINVLGPIAVGSRLLFATDNDNGRLWASDGTPAGTQPIKDLHNETFSFGTTSGDFLYFLWDDGIHGRELWRTDGTSAGTTLVADIAPGEAHSGIFDVIRRPNGAVFFGADDLVSGEEPWITDGTPAGTYVINIVAETASGSSPADFTIVNGKLWFAAHDGTQRTLWTSDGTTAGTASLGILRETYLYPEIRSVLSGGLYYFVAGDFPALELWRSDGTFDGTFRLFTMSQPRFFEALIPFKGGLFFQGSDAAHGAEPWFTDGTVAGTRMIADINAGTGDSFGSANGTMAAGDYVYFPADGPSGRQPWRTNGTTVQQLSTSNLSRSPQAFTQVGDAVYFAAYEHDSAFSLWRSSIASGETTLLRRFGNRRAPDAMWSVGGGLLFFTNEELWRSDGTEAGTVRVAERLEVAPCHVREDYVVGDGVLYWYSVYPDVELWRTDGTIAGTFRLARLKGPFAESLQTCLPHYLHYSNGRLFFIGNDDLHGAEPWESNGTIAGTRLLYDVNPGPASSDPSSFVSIGTTLFFAATYGMSDRELWAYTIGCDGRECRPRRRAARH